MFDLDREIRRIALEGRAKRGGGGEEECSMPAAAALTDEAHELVAAAISRLFGIGEEAVRLYNDAMGGEGLWIVDTPPIVLSAFLNFDGWRKGFALLTSRKYVVFVNDPPDRILVLGRETLSPENSARGRKGAVQLINMSIESSSEGVLYKDSNGSVLDPAEITALVVKWVTG